MALPHYPFKRSPAVGEAVDPLDLTLVKLFREALIELPDEKSFAVPFDGSYHYLCIADVLLGQAKTNSFQYNLAIWGEAATSEDAESCGVIAAWTKAAHTAGEIQLIHPSAFPDRAARVQISGQGDYWGLDGLNSWNWGYWTSAPLLPEYHLNLWLGDYADTKAFTAYCRNVIAWLWLQFY